jgi:lysophospholipase L1-like esterase
MVTKLINYTLTVILYLINIIASVSGQENIKIMPLGNSITEGYTDGTLTNEQMIGYRYGLRYLLKNRGYKVDFVGSQSGGSAYFSDCQHAGISGTRDQYVLQLLINGYDERNNVQILIPPRPYLDEFNPDIILLHIGTNDISHEGDAALTNQKISDILDQVDQYEARANKEVIVFLALIINRIKPWNAGSAATQTTSFNKGIKSMAQARIATGDKIVIVDMENEAGFLYTSDDMSPDGLHPNEVGYSKMAAHWFSSITSNYNTAPEISEIPDQIFNEGGSSSIISLDNYVRDIEDPDSLIIWSTDQLGASNLNISINAKRQVVVTPIDSNWSGSQIVVFTATDRGENGKYIKFAKDTVAFTITPINDSPVITSSPRLEISVGEVYNYTLTATDIDNAVIILSAVTIPSWLTFSETTGMLTGTPKAVNQGQNQVILRASDGLLNTDQEFFITVDNPDALVDAEETKFFMYPVPAHSYIMIESGNFTGETILEVMNSSGMIVQKSSVQFNQHSYRLDLGKFGNGIYYLHLISKSVNYIGKFSILN